MSSFLDKPSITTSSSTPNLTALEKKLAALVPSLRNSGDSFRNPAAPNGPHLDEEDIASLKLSVPPRADNDIISASAPGSLQSSPRGGRREVPLPLSATADVLDRPRTLPPKSTAELQKHMKEYEEISKQIKKSLEKEAKDKQKKEAIKSTREKKLIEYRKLWNEEVLPNWEKKHDTKKVQEMWRFGLPPSVRGQVWKYAIGNELFITKDLFDISCGHAQLTKATINGTPPVHRHQIDGATKNGRGEVLEPVSMDELLGKEGTVLLVSLDLPPDFPARQLFVVGGPMHQQMTQVLEAYVAYRPDVGYAPCMSYLVAGFLLNMEAMDAFICLANFINKPFNLAFYITDRSQMYKYTKTADDIIATLLPKIHKHFQEIGIAPEHYLVEWFMTIFLKPLPLDVASRIWDLYFLDGEIFLFKIVLSLLKMYSHQLETYPKDLCINLLTKFPADINEEELFETTALFNIDPKKFQKLLR